MINCTVDGIDPGTTEFHPDVIQFSGVGQSKENFIYYGIEAFNLHSQCIFANGVSSLDNVALVNLSFGKADVSSQMSQWRVDSSDHLLFWGITLHNQRMQFREGTLTNLSVMGCCWQKLHSGDIVLNDDDFISNHYVEYDVYAALTPGTDVSVGDPLFDDQAANNFKPAPGSLLLNRVVVPPIPVDITGAQRPAPCSVGAFE